MARNTILLSDIINDFLLMHSDDDYVNNVTETQLKVLGKRGLRELGFDILRRIKGIILPLNEDNMTIDLPDDFVDWTRIGTVAKDGLFYIFKENRNIAAPMRYDYDVDGNPIDSNGDGVYDRVEGKDPESGIRVNTTEAYYHSTGLYVGGGNGGGLYGFGGAHHRGEFRVNLEQNRIEIQSNIDVSELAIEYIADEALSENPSVHPYAADALDKYLYYRLAARSTIVNALEKNRARKDYLSALKLANSRMKSFTKDEALAQGRKNIRLSPNF